MKTNIALLLAAITLSAPIALAHPDHDLPNIKNLRIAPPPPAEKPYGRPGDASQASRTVNLDINDKLRITPAELNVKQGETIKFVVTNSAKSPQQWVLGTLNDLKERATMFKQFPKMEINQANQMQVKPGESAELLWQFSQAGVFNFGCGALACLEANAIGKIVVDAK